MSINDSPDGREAKDSISMENHSVTAMILQLQPEREKSALLCILPAWEINSTLEISISINKEINTVYSE